MSAPVTPNVASVGGKIPAAWYNSDVGGGIGWLNNPDRVMVYVGIGGTVLTNAAWTVLTWDSEQYDTNVMHSLTTNTSRLVAQNTGLYAVNFQITIANNGTGIRLYQLRKNSAGSQATGTPLSGNPTFQATESGSNVFVFGQSLDVQLTAGEYIELFAFQNAGGTLGTQIGAAVTYMQMRWVANS